MQTYVYSSIKLLAFLSLVFSVSTFSGTSVPGLFYWLPGTWEMKNMNGNSRLEVWKKKDDFTFTGKGLRITGQDTILLESIELTYRENEYWYIPAVPDQNDGTPVPFRLVRQEEGMYTFENPDHDFPQRIIYHLKPIYTIIPYKASTGDTLLVRVETFDHHGIDFQFFRI